MPILHRTVSILFLSLFPVILTARETDHWETIIRTGNSCRYLVPGFTPDPTWVDADFDDSSWESGSGGVGYGDLDDSTSIEPAISVYCRYHFNLTDPLLISSMLVDVDFDDGFVAYLNGAEVGRANMGQPGNATSWDQFADGLHEAVLRNGNSPYRIELDALMEGLLVTGDNVLSIEVHNESQGSTDLSSNIFLHAGINVPGQYFQETPSWFYPPFNEDSTLLPLVVIDTEGKEIPNDPRITARMGLIYNNQGGYNTLSDPYNGYDGQISIELRGESSLWIYPKNSFSIETQTDSGTNNNVSLLGLPKENDFVLYGPYGDKSLIRNVLSYRIYEKFGHYSPRTRFIELVINNEYMGLYVLVEKIKRDKNRVDIAKITPNDTSAVDISGGYILRIDKLSGMDPSQYWISNVQPPIEGYNPVTYQNFDPKYDEISPEQHDYMVNYMEAFELALTSPDFKDPRVGYRAYLDIPSFIDMMIFNEFTKDVDAFRLSHYFYKQKDTKGGLLVNGPPWDYNLTYGNSDFSENIHLTSEWIYTLGITIYWWARIMEDPWFRNQLYCRWDEIGATVLHPDSVSAMIDTTLSPIREAVTRNFQRWPILGNYIWPNYFVGQNFMEEEAFLRSWIEQRLAWLEFKWGGLCEPTSSASDRAIPRSPDVRVFPNPSDFSKIYIAVNTADVAGMLVRLYDIQGMLIYQKNEEIHGIENVYPLPDLSFLPGGTYILEVSDGKRFREMVKLIRK